jgi:hypothetical protein
MSSAVLLATVSKVPFYFAGGILAAWAVVLAAIGLSRPAFPGNSGGARVVMAISFVLMAAAIAASILTSTFE